MPQLDPEMTPSFLVPRPTGSSPTNGGNRVRGCTGLGALERSRLPAGCSGRALSRSCTRPWQQEEQERVPGQVTAPHHPILVICECQRVPRCCVPSPNPPLQTHHRSPATSTAPPAPPATQVPPHHHYDQCLRSTGRDHEAPWARSSLSHISEPLQHLPAGFWPLLGFLGKRGCSSAQPPHVWVCTGGCACAQGWGCARGWECAWVGAHVHGDGSVHAVGGVHGDGGVHGGLWVPTYSLSLPSASQMPEAGAGVGQSTHSWVPP